MKLPVIIFLLLFLKGGAQVKQHSKATGKTITGKVSAGKDGVFYFTTASVVRTSAGVYVTDSIKVRTLWDNITYKAGTHTATWDGKNDDGETILNPADTYTIKVLTNQVQYTWEGTIGNTSDSMTGNTKHQGYYNCMTGLVFASNGYGYFCNGFSEGESSYSKLLTAAPQAKVNFYNSTSRIITLNTEFVCTDNQAVYWAGFDSYSNGNSMVHATRTSDDAHVIFPAGELYTVKHGVTFPSVISKVNSPGSKITGLAVQKKGDYLFVSRSALNQLQVLHKTTGTLMQTLAVPTPKTICVDADDNLWMVSGTGTVAKYNVHNNGAISAPMLTVSGILDPLAVQVSPEGNTVVIADGATSQQLKAFDNATGKPLWVLGEAGGYVADATVTDHKFYLFDNNTRANISFHSFVAFQPDGSFWVNDPGNFRVQHYTKNRVFVNRIMAMGTTYSTYVDPNNPARLFAGPLEFAIDYKTVLSGKTGWSLVKNWGANITSIYNRNFLLYPTTLSNGKTYAFLRKRSGVNSMEMVELPASGPLRHTGTYRNGALTMDQQGGLQVMAKAAPGGSSVIKRYELTGFSNSDNPEWSNTPEIVATTPPLTMDDPNDILTGQCITASNKVVIYCPDKERVRGAPYTGYHLGAIHRNQQTWLWKTEKATHINYQGPYPPAGVFDIGNYVHNNAGGTLSIFGRNIFTSYHGEFWKNSQTNKYNHYWDNGLAIGQFGVVKEETSGNAPAMFAGNALTPMVVADPVSVNSAYLYHGDESTHSGVHRWKISGLNTIAEQLIEVPFPSGYVAPPADYVDLMAGLPFDESLANNTHGWTRIPDADTTGWTIRTNYYTYDRRAGKDILVSFSPTANKNYYLKRDLGNNQISKSWALEGMIGFSGGDGNRASIGTFLEVLDASGKLICSISFEWEIKPNSSSLRANGKPLKSWPISTTGEIFTKYFKPLRLSVESGVLRVAYNNEKPVLVPIADKMANWRTPKTLQVRGTTGPSKPFSAKKMILGSFKFFKS